MKVEQTDRLRLGSKTGRNVVFIVCSVKLRQYGALGAMHNICKSTSLLKLMKLRAGPHAAVS